MAETMQLEAVAALHSEVILVDRPVPDALGYLVAALRHTGRELEPDRYERLEKVCAAWAGEYDLLFLTRIDPTIGLGPSRDENSDFRLGAATAMAEIIDRLFPNRCILTIGGVDAALSLALERINVWRKRS